MEFPLPTAKAVRYEDMVLFDPRLSLDATSPTYDWLMFDWSYEGEDGRYGICLNDGDRDGFDDVDDDDLSDFLDSFAEAVADAYLTRAVANREVLVRPVPDIVADAWNDAVYDLERTTHA